VLIEIPANSGVKYEVDKETGTAAALRVICGVNLEPQLPTYAQQHELSAFMCYWEG